eukprot:CAMPEP_0205944622 /NCGR_PEP_ID=MMETSP1325-20131115/63716_1 /ASSEMBLY_ACC=CAM_ASM_000708 /TAXON_ID=236786 /ORGANISM="Florenciella sp., Strain RCC1007" /LENGTH=86 /DNA_ID=CAMNT_0053315537 /DNA_START=217 /DNA_END=477 /DNA_ORIENTATION=+
MSTSGSIGAPLVLNSVREVVHDGRQRWHRILPLAPLLFDILVHGAVTIRWWRAHIVCRTRVTPPAFLRGAARAAFVGGACVGEALG